MSAGTRIGPYEITGQLGAGGMGVVYRARDARLGREVAVKVLPEAFAADADRVRRFEQEARAVAALSHPHILAVFDVGSHDGSPFIVTELLEGETLRERIESGGLTVRKALELASQIARGLAAAHERGIVHRDLKPANVFVTRDGTVKLLDFGLAKLAEGTVEAGVASEASTLAERTRAGAVVGTVGYMAPEQVRAQEVTPSTDIFALGCVLYEMLSGRRAFQGETPADTLSAILSKDPPPLSGPGRERTVPPALERVVLRCLEKRPQDRFGSVRDLTFALEAAGEAAPREVAVSAPEELRPYPGLAAFTTADAERFFGREDEVAAMWERIPGRGMLALIGPSGAGKSSFLRAGLVPHAPAGWRCVVATPGPAPCKGLARAMTRELQGDPEALAMLVDFDDADVAVEVTATWRQRSDHALVVIDQFEELFTLNPESEQASFAQLLGRLVDEAGVHVLLSLRDDFFFRCHEHPVLREVFDKVTPLGPPVGEALRRAVEKPAEPLGFAFDEGLVDEMIAEVAAEKGALPLLAFTVARLWELRDREGKRLTRAAYERLGGVGGALAQHAEQVLEEVGRERQPLVRELFRNLVTAQGTRASREAEELLSVFPEGQRADAREVLSRLVDARLLTSFEEDGGEGEAPSRHRIEIVHESLLSAWPRLVRWQTQDAHGARLRDEVRQAARLWAEHGRGEDYLWSGKAYREFAVWREAYPGGLSGTEEAFARAMTALAGRRRRRRRMAAAALLLVATGVGSVTTALWRRGVQETRRAESAARQHEAAKLLALGQLRLGDHPNAALAYALAALEMADNEPARRFAVEALWQGPPALFLTGPTPWSLAWSQDGRWLAMGGGDGVDLLESDGSAARRLTSALERVAGFSADGRRLVTLPDAAPSTRHVWAIPEGRLERALELPGQSKRAWLGDDSLLAYSFDESAPEGERPAAMHRLPLDGSPPQVLGRWKSRGLASLLHLDLDPSAGRLYSLQGGRLLEQRLGDLSAPGRVLGAHEGDGVKVAAWRGRDRAVTADSSREVRIWDVAAARLERKLDSPLPVDRIALDANGRFLATGHYSGEVSTFPVALFDLRAPLAAEPAPLRVDMSDLLQVRFSADGSWLATVHNGTAVLWNMAGARSTVLVRGRLLTSNVAFTPDGDLLSTSEGSLVLRRWSPSPGAGDGTRELLSRPGPSWLRLDAVDPLGRFVVVTAYDEAELFVVPLDGSPASRHRIKGPENFRASFGRLHPGGRFLARYIYAWGRPEASAFHVFDLETGDQRTLDTRFEESERCEEPGGELSGFAEPVWLPDGRLVSDGDGGLRVWDLAAGTSRQLRACRAIQRSGHLFLLATPDARTVVRLDGAVQVGETSSLSAFDLAAQETREITSHGNRLYSFALDPSGTVLATGSRDGTVRVGRLTGEEPHLLFGHSGPVWTMAVSPDGRWIASGSEDGTVRLWPMPDLSQPPLHTWPHDELLAKLKSLTNLRAVRDPSADTGWKIEIGPFPGWAETPGWEP